MLAGRGGGGSRGPCLAGGLLGAMSISPGAAEVVTCSGGMLHGFSICASRHRGSHSMRTQWVRLTPNVLCICVKCVAVCEHRLQAGPCTLRGITCALSTPDSAEAPAALAVTIISYVLAFGRTYQTSNFALALISPRPFRKFVEISMPTTLTSLPARLETYSCSLSLTLERVFHRE